MENNSNSSLLIFDEFTLVRNRINTLFQKLNINVYEASNDTVLFNFLSNEDYPINIIIMDIGYNVDVGLRLLSKVKEKSPKTPIIILTANNKRSVFIRGVAEGASDYILKPFEDDYLSQKVLSLLQKQHQDKLNKESSNKENPRHHIVLDVQSYLNTELKKSQKGNYELTVLMSTFFIPTQELDDKVEKQYIQVSDLLYDHLKSSFFNTDVLVRYGSQAFIGVFPYCGLDNTTKLEEKIMKNFEELKKEKKELSAFHLGISTMTCPSEIADAKELLLSLGVQMKAVIDDIKKA